jgi:uncharacterized damage-inducible protein DinB
VTPTQAVERLVKASVHLDDADLDRTYVWRDYDEDGLRFALLTAHHILRDTAASVAAARLRAGRPFTEAQRILAQIHEAYRDLTGALAGTSEDDLDHVPTVGQWPVRQVLAHALDAESAFLTAIRLALDGVRAGTPSGRASREVWEVREAAIADPAGSRADALNALFESHVRVLGELSDVTDAELDTPSFFWESEGYPVRFRMHRFDEHMRQHTIQVDKTLVAIGHPPTEAERLVRNLYTALAGVESVASDAGAGGEVLDRCTASIDDIARQVEDIARTA